ncbi:hypothetical protein [Rufibacter latericius]|uniref:Uncharacterized protein n=1 Tax=Rufibacter latericius TaxID=2487040 RepID=A0A3M9M963_9BACT|nr:hypothetical protein [Rufibacter latericius]RNI22026.1 hypothetical protein EFB08_23115 [Rufibacter latericius]
MDCHLREESCPRIEIAESIRKEKAQVKEIELVVIPRFESRGEPVKDIFQNIIAWLPKSTCSQKP